MHKINELEYCFGINKFCSTLLSLTKTRKATDDDYKLETSSGNRNLLDKYF
jgi:hypothetical protein